MRFGKYLIIASAASIIGISAGAVNAYAEEYVCPAEIQICSDITTADETSEYLQDEDVLTAENEETFGWNEDEEGRKYYIDENGARAVGYQIIEEREYYFAANGIMKNGWYTIDETRMYFSPENGERQYGWIEYNGNRYYADKTGKYTGFHTIDEKKYIFDQNGILMSGWIEYEGNKYYGDEENGLYSGEQEIGGIKYLFSSMGKFRSGWQTVDGLRVFYGYDETAPVYGWITYNNCIYYADKENGKYTGDKSIGGSKYRFSDIGTLCTGFQKFSDGVRYYKEDGTAVKGFFKLNGKNYYFDDSYLMKTGFQKISGKNYYFDKDGAMQTGFQTISGKKYYFDKNGVMQTDWQTIGGKKYYFDKNGVMQTGWQTMSGKKYYFDKDGVMQTGWQTIDGKKYFFDKNGVMESGYWKTSGGNKSYIGADGKMCKDGVFQVEQSYYYFDKDGIMQTGWQKVGDDYYLFDRLSGQRQANCTTDGVTINKDGKAVINTWSQSKIETMMTAHRILLEQTSPADSMEEKRLKCFKWVMSASYHRYRMLEKMYNEQGWEMTFANDVFSFQRGCCVSEASAVAFLFREIGYTDVAVCHDTSHAWAVIGDRLYDTLFAESKDFNSNYDVIPTDYRVTPAYKREIG